MNEPMTLEKAREIVARKERFDFLDAADVSVSDLPENDSAVAEARGFLTAHALLSSENEKLAGQLKAATQEWHDADTLRAKFQDQLDCTQLDLSSARTEIASLRAEVEKLRRWEREGQPESSEYAAGWMGHKIAVGDSLARLEKEITLHREAAKELVKAATDATKCNFLQVSGHRGNCETCVKALSYALGAHDCLVLSEAKTSPQDPERGK